MPLEPGSIVGDYRILAILGAGGMGQVYKVQNLLSNRTEAMKVLLSDLSAQPQQLERFVREIQVQASLIHPNIASLYTASRQDNRLLMFMELVEGETLAARLSQGPLNVDAAVNSSSQILNALVYAHERGVVHRDIKPSNIMLTTSGIAKLLDFGLAAAKGDKRLTLTGNVLGSLHYMSPEQVRGESPTPSSDIYSFGLTMYEMLTGRRGIEGNSDYAIMTAHLQRMPEPPGSINPAIPEMLSQIVLKAVAKNPAERFASTLEFKAAVDQYRNHTPRVPIQEPVFRPISHPAEPVKQPGPVTPAPSGPVIASPPTLSTQTISPNLPTAPSSQPRKPSFALVSVIAGIVVLIAGGGLFYWRQEARPPVAAPATPPSIAAAKPEPEPFTEVPAPKTTRPEPASKTEKKPTPVTAEAKNSTPPERVTAPVTTPPAEPPAQPVTQTTATAPPPPAKTAQAPPAKSVQQLEDEEWTRVSASRDPAQLRQFVATHRNSAYTSQAVAVLGDIAWQSVGSSAAELREYAAQFPSSIHAPEALEKAKQIEARQAVLDVVARFQEAFSARDLKRVRALWPGANKETIDRISELFKKSRTVTLVLRPQREPRLGGNSAEVACQEQLTFLDGSKPRTTEAIARIRLVKSENTWIIEGITSTPPSLYNPF